MRIRRRPQPSLQQASDPITPASPSQTQRNAARNRSCLEGDDDEEGRPHANADLGRQKSGVARRQALPQDTAVDSGVSVGGGQRAAGDVHMRCGTVENGHHSWDQKHSVACFGAVGSKLELAGSSKVEEHANGALLTMAPAGVSVKDEEKVISNGSVGGGAHKKRRGSAVLLEGSRCSRVNGRGWRCSQPTLVGYSLCEHHLGKGRARSSSASGGSRGGLGQLGRTEHRAKVPTSVAAVGAVTVTAVPNTEGRPSLPHC